MIQKSLTLDLKTHQLHLRHIYKSDGGQPILMLHGTIENGRIFYNEKDKGLACYLASQGFNVFVLDYRGRGKSRPKIKHNYNHGYHECIVEDIPAAINYVFKVTGRKMHVICHSWGGILFHSSYTRFKELQDKVVSVVCFGTKRQVLVWNLERLLKVTFFWHRLAPWLAKRTGYLDAEKFGFGAESETYLSVKQSSDWVKPSKWLDSVDGFDYGESAKTTKWPPTWHLTGSKDKVLGHSKDVNLFINESNPNAKFSELSKVNGNLVNYDHINILTDKQAVNDHFPLITKWLSEH